MNPFLGIMLHSIGGFAAGSFYIPFKKVRNWARESYWLVGVFFSWIIMPWLIAFLTVPKLTSILCEAPPKSIFLCYLFGLLWGIGGLTFGLSMRYLGMSLGYALSLGFCAVFGTIIPPIFKGVFGELITRASGLTMLAGLPRMERNQPANTSSCSHWNTCVNLINICGWVRKLS